MCIWPEMLDADLDQALGGNVVPCFTIKREQMTKVKMHCGR